MKADHKKALAETKERDIKIYNKYLIVGELEEEMNDNTTKYEQQLQEVGIKMDKVKQR
jgi:hypothetical protein